MSDVNKKRVFVVMGGCVGDEHIIAIYTSARKAERRKIREDQACKGLEPWVEEWPIEK